MDLARVLFVSVWDVQFIQSLDQRFRGGTGYRVVATSSDVQVGDIRFNLLR